ncbi:hypothetical protein HD806DRAFT_540541 [Xylariaceae sp. AK1471]|nr:hypothetical protein HD806DRAFT_540541 [Xylariaceae sp. AK1471]
MDYAAASIRFGRIARHLLAARDEDADKEKNCHPQPDVDLCEKPGSSDKTTPIAIGVIVGIIVVGTLAVLTYLHLRRKRSDEKEWPKNNQELDDYGIEVPSAGVRQPQNVYHQQDQHSQNNQNNHHDQYEQQPRGSLDDLERSLRGGQATQTAQTTGAFRRHDEQISADMKPVEPSDRI